MMAKELEAELAAHPDLPVYYFDGSQSWDIEVFKATHRTGDHLFLVRKPRSMEQTLIEACRNAIAALNCIAGASASGLSSPGELVSMATSALKEGIQAYNSVHRGR